jgi:hypothetical protein
MKHHLEHNHDGDVNVNINITIPAADMASVINVAMDATVAVIAAFTVSSIVRTLVKRS